MLISLTSMPRILAVTELAVIVHAYLWVDMFFTASQATHTGKWRSFLDGWKEEDPDCKFTSLNLDFREKSRSEERRVGKECQ